jgi:flagellar M-ring protein FliF
VASVVGPGHVRVQVAADMNYNHTSETAEIYDPDSKVVRSTQTVEQNASDANGATNGAVSVASALPGGQQASQGNGSDNTKSNSTRTEETTNYEISKTVRTSTQDGGQVKKLSVAVAVDGVSSTGAGGKDDYKPRSAQELAQIDSLVKSAIGYDKTRGDVVQVVNMAFAKMDVGPTTPAATPLLGLDSSDWFKIIEVAILSLTALLIGFFVLRPLIGRMFAPNPVSGGQIAYAPQQSAGQLPAPAQMQQGGAISQAASGGALPSPADSMIDISRIEGQVRESSIRKVGEVVQAHPEEALAILRSWLHQPV